MTYFHAEFKLRVRTLNDQRYGKEFYIKAINNKLLTGCLNTITNTLGRSSFLTVGHCCLPQKHKAVSTSL